MMLRRRDLDAEVDQFRAQSGVNGLLSEQWHKVRCWLVSRLSRNLEEDSWPLIKRLLAESFPKYARKYAIAFALMMIVAAMTAFSA